MKNLLLKKFYSSYVIIFFTNCLLIPLTMAEVDAERVTTPHGYKAGKFCEKDAKQFMGELTNANKDRSAKIDELREQIEKLSKRNVVLTEVKAMKDNYEKSILELAKNKENPTATDMLNPLKSTMRNGLMINAISLLLKNDNLNDNQPLTMNTICQGEESLKICEMDSAKKEYRHKLTPLLTAFKKAYTKVGEKKDQASLRTEINNIMSAIPKDLTPDVILGLIDAKAPELSRILSQDLPRNKIEECLSASQNAKESCNDLVSDPKNISSFKSAIASEAVVLNYSLASGLGPAFKELSRMRQVELEQIFNYTSDSADAKMRFKQMATESVAKTREFSARFKKQEITVQNMSTPVIKPTLSEQAIFFYNPPPLGFKGIIEGEREELESQAILDANQQSKDFSEECNFEQKLLNSNSDDGMISKCQKHLERLKIGFELRQSEYGKKLTALDEEMKILAANDNFNKIENLKKYLAEKYICECNSKNEPITKKDKSLILNIQTCNQVDYSNTIKLTSFENLTSNMGAILNIEFTKDINTDKSKCDEIASPANLLQYYKSCQGENLKAFKELCSMVDRVKKNSDKAIEEERKWEERSTKYWIDTDANGKIKLTPKKSNSRVFAEGFLPVAIPALLPNWLYDYKLRSDITALTNQGMFNKQFFHSVSVYDQNPWMYDYTNMMFANPFEFNTNGSLKQTSSATTGFNFGM